MLQRRREGHGVLGEEETELGVILSEAVREDLTGKRTSEQRSERSDRLSHTESWEDAPSGASAHAQARRPPTSTAVPPQLRQDCVATGPWAALRQQGLFLV